MRDAGCQTRHHGSPHYFIDGVYSVFDFSSISLEGLWKSVTKANHDSDWGRCMALVTQVVDRIEG